MAKVFFTVALSLAALCAATSSKNVANTDMLKHIQRLDEKIIGLEEKHGAELKAIKEITSTREENLVRLIEELEKRVIRLENKNREVVKENDEFRRNLLKSILRHKVKDNYGDTSEIGLIEDGVDETLDTTDYNIAFSVYMDHDANNLGTNQPLVFNKILLNDGHGYNQHSGMFTAPVAGVYSFTFFIGERDNNQAVAALCINSTDQVDAIAQTDNAQEDAQGGNSAVLRVAAGDVVYVRSFYGGHIDNDKRLTTFAGFLLYPVDGDSLTVVGK